jgi:hypothetical protein
MLVANVATVQCVPSSECQIAPPAPTAASPDSPQQIERMPFVDGPFATVQRSKGMQSLTVRFAAALTAFEPERAVTEYEPASHGNKSGMLRFVAMAPAILLPLCRHSKVGGQLHITEAVKKAPSRAHAVTSFGFEPNVGTTILCQTAPFEPTARKLFEDAAMPPQTVFNGMW